MCIELEPANQSLAEHAAALAEVVDELAGPNGQYPVDLIGHGVGGLVAAWYSQYRDDASQRRRLITLGTAWHGTRTAVLTSHSLSQKLVYKAPILDSLKPKASQNKLHLES